MALSDDGTARMTWRWFHKTVRTADGAESVVTPGHVPAPLKFGSGRRKRLVASELLGDFSRSRLRDRRTAVERGIQARVDSDPVIGARPSLTRTTRLCSRLL